MPQILFPFMHYDDAPAAIEWLGRAFGFETLAVHAAPDGTVVHAELQLEGEVVMLGTARPQHALGMMQPRTAGGTTQGVYVVLERDAIDAHCARARTAGATIVLEPHDTDYGSRDYAALDPEGHLWSFGTYRPAVQRTPA